MQMQNNYKKMPAMQWSLNEVEVSRSEQENTMNKEFSIVIPYYKKLYELDLVLTGLSMQDFDKNKFEIMIIDDGSDDTVREVIKKHEEHMEVKYFNLHHTGNRALVRNVGFKKCTGNRIIMLDSDMIAESTMLSEFYEATKADQKAISLGTRTCLLKMDKARITSETVKEHFDIIRNLPGLTDERAVNIHLKNIYGVEYRANWQLFFSHCLCVCRDEVLNVGGFDEQFGNHWGAEDIELGFRLHQNGCTISLNENVRCYHIYHDYNFKKNIISLKKNYSLFLKKHRYWEVENFTREYETWAVEANEIQKRIQNKLFSAPAIHDQNNLLDSLPEKTLLAGIENEYLIQSPKIELAFLPESGIRNDKIVPVMGLETNYPCDYFNCTLMSGNYKKVNYGLFLRLKNEFERISKKVLIINENEIFEAKNNTGAEKNRPLKKNRYLLFSLSTECNLGNYNFCNQNDLLNLAIAEHTQGIEVGLQKAFDPFNMVDFNTGYLWLSNKDKIQVLNTLFCHELNFCADEMFHFVDIDYLPLLPRSIENKIAWVDMAYANQENHVSRQVEDAAIVLCKKKNEVHKFSHALKTDFLPAGIDDIKINTIKKTVKKANTDVFTYLYINQFMDSYSNIDIVIDAFTELYQGDGLVRLKIVWPGPLYTAKELYALTGNKSWRHIFHSYEDRFASNQLEYFNRLLKKCVNTENVVLCTKNMSDEACSEELFHCDCFIQLNSGCTVFQLVLESIAFGKKPIIPNDSTYDGYFSQNHCFQVQTEKISPIFLEKNIWPFNEDLQPACNYYFVNKIQKESLRNIFMAIDKKRDRCALSERESDMFMQEFSWRSIAEKLNAILFQ